MRRIKILHVIDKLAMDGVNPSSCTVLLGDWAETLDPDRFLTSVCTLRDPDPAGRYLEKRNVQVHYLGYGKFSPKNIAGISRLIRQDQIDILHLHGYSAANFGRIASWKNGIPNIVHEHAVLKLQPHQYLADKILSRLTDVAIAVSDNVRDFMVHQRCISASKIRVIGNGINLDRYKNRDGPFIQNKRTELGISQNSKLAGTVTRLREEKGNEHLIRAVPAILKQVPDFELLIIGDGPLRKQLQEMAMKLGVSNAIRFLGFRSDVPDLLPLLDVQVIPSLTEGFPLCLAEAMAAGNAVVATEVGGMKEIGRDEVNVLFVPPGDSVSLAEKIIHVLQDTKLAARISESAKQASYEFSIENCACRLAGVYKELVSKQLNNGSS